MICTPQPVCSGYQMEKNKVNEACSMYGGEKRCMQGFCGETQGKKTTLKTQALMGG